MPKIDRLNRLKRLSDQQRDEKSRIEGRIDSIIDELRKEGYDSVEDAKKGLALLSKRIKMKNNSFNRKLEEFNERYADQLQESNNRS